LTYQAIYYGFLPRILMNRPDRIPQLIQELNESDLEEEKEEIPDPSHLVDHNLEERQPEASGREIKLSYQIE
jgi:hypothetical protein